MKKTAFTEKTFAESWKRKTISSGIWGNCSPSGVRGSAPVVSSFLQTKCKFIDVLKQFLVMYENIWHFLK